MPFERIIKKIKPLQIVIGLVVSITAGILTYYATPFLPFQPEQEITFKNLRTNYPPSISDRLNEAINNYEAENYNASLAHLNSISLSLQSSQKRISPKQEALIHSIMGACNYNLKKFSDSIKHLEKSLSLSPSSFTHKLLSEIYFEKYQATGSEEYLIKHKEHADSAYKLKISSVSPSKREVSSQFSNLENKFVAVLLGKNKDGLINKSINPLPYERKKLIKNNYIYRATYKKYEHLDSAFINNIGNKEGKIFLISIGINKYQDKKINTLRYAEKDSKDIIKSFSQAYKGKEILHHVINGRNATKEGILLTISSVAKKANSKDKIIVYYSGHGYANEESLDNYILPSNGVSDSLESTAIPVKKISRIINNNTNAKSVVIIDACNENINKKTTPLAHANIKNTTFIFSSSNGQLSAESSRFKNGVFTHYLTKALRKPEILDRNNDKELSIKELLSYVNSNMQDYLSKQGVQQNINVVQYTEANKLLKKGTANPSLLFESVPNINSVVLPSYLEGLADP